MAKRGTYKGGIRFRGDYRRLTPTDKKTLENLENNEILSTIREIANDSGIFNQLRKSAQKLVQLAVGYEGHEQDIDPTLWDQWCEFLERLWRMENGYETHKKNLLTKVRKSPSLGLYLQRYKKEEINSKMTLTQVNNARQWCRLADKASDHPALKPYLQRHGLKKEELIASKTHVGLSKLLSDLDKQAQISSLANHPNFASLQRSVDECFELEYIELRKLADELESMRDMSIEVTKDGELVAVLV